MEGNKSETNGVSGMALTPLDELRPTRTKSSVMGSVMGSVIEKELAQVLADNVAMWSGPSGINTETLAQPPNDNVV